MAGVLAQIDVALVPDLGEDLLHPLDVHVVGGANERVVLDVQDAPELLEVLDHGVGELFRRQPLLGGAALDLLAVLVGPGQEQHPEAPQLLVALDDVGQDGGVGMADVRDIVHVVDRGGQVKFFHGALLLPGAENRIIA